MNLLCSLTVTAETIPAGTPTQVALPGLGRAEGGIRRNRARESWRRPSTALSREHGAIPIPSAPAHSNSPPAMEGSSSPKETDTFRTMGIQVQALEGHSSSKMSEMRQGHLPLSQITPGSIPPGLGHSQGCYSNVAMMPVKDHGVGNACASFPFTSHSQGTSSSQMIIPQKPGESTSKHFPQNSGINKGFQSLTPTKSLEDKGFGFPKQVHCLSVQEGAGHHLSSHGSFLALPSSTQHSKDGQSMEPQRDNLNTVYTHGIYN